MAAIGLLTIYRDIKDWTDRNPIPLEENRQLNPAKREILSQTSKENWKPKASVQCSKKDHKSNDCKTTTNVEDHKIMLN